MRRSDPDSSSIVTLQTLSRKPTMPIAIPHAPNKKLTKLKAQYATKKCFLVYFELGNAFYDL
eukprot:6176591-Pleurochrysis_carterae.AAC.1